MKMHESSGGKRESRQERRRLGAVLGEPGVALALICLLLIVMSWGCTSSGTFPASSGTTVNLSQKNYRVVKANAVGTSTGFKLFMFIPIVPTRYNAALSDLYQQAGVMEGTASTLVNVSQEQSSLYLLLFSLPKLTVRADIIEFTE